MAGSGEHLASNPFHVLGLRPGATRVEIEREGQKLLAMLELDLSAAERYATPLGERERTPDLVRRSLGELRDPRRRIVHEVWARLEPAPVAPAAAEDEAGRRPWVGALAALGWRSRSRARDGEEPR